MADNCCSACSAVLPAEASEADVPAEVPKWRPDEQLVPGILAGAPVRMANLTDNDRAWAVAGLGAAGLTAEDIRDRLKCSLRLVRAIQALPLTRACTYAQIETTNWIRENQLLQGGLRRRDAEIRTLEQELDRVRGKLSRLIDAHIVGTPTCRRCGTPWDKGNTMFEGTKRRCRNCARLKQQAYRERQRERAVELTPDGGPTIDMSEFTLGALEQLGDVLYEINRAATDPPRQAQSPE